MSPQSLVSSIAFGRLTENMYQQNPERLRKTSDTLSDYMQVYTVMLLHYIVFSHLFLKILLLYAVGIGALSY